MKFVIAIVLCLGCLAIGAPEDGTAIGEMVERLDDDQFVVRQRAAAELMKTGAAAIPQLAVAAKSGSVEQRARAADILRSIQSQRIARGFRELGARADKDVDVERGMVLIAQMLDPEVTTKSVAAQLDGVAAAVRKSLGEGVDPKSLGGTEIVVAISGVLKENYGLAGDSQNYDHPDNSSIHRVFEQKNGLPILLSEIAVAVGKRLDVPIVGVAVPRNYMFKYDASRAPAGRGGEDVIIDAFGGWEVVSPQEISQTWIFHPGELEASDPKATLVRMLSNLESDFGGNGELKQAAKVRKYRSLLEGQNSPSSGDSPGK
jgi:regulator of sirC expression with transglutaminase-like and TPR domain